MFTVDRRVLHESECPGQPTAGASVDRDDDFDIGDRVFRVAVELLGHTLYVVRPFDNRVTVISLAARLASGVVLGDLADPSLDIPSTATVAAGRLWAVNLRFTTPPEPTTAYWITRLPLRP